MSDDDPISLRESAARDFYGPLAGSERSARRVGWESEAAQRARLTALVDELEPLGRIDSVLDVGCGEGELALLLAERGYQGAYRGEDILPEMVDRARERFADQPEIELARQDSFEASAPFADAVVLSGALNTRVHFDHPDQEGRHQEEVEAAIEHLWARARRVLVFDVAVSDRHHGGAGILGVDLARLWQVCRSLSPCPVVRVREDGMPGEALVVLERDRRDRLAGLIPDPVHVVERAEIHLEAGEPEAAHDVLLGVRTPEAHLVRALADNALGRLRQGERALRELTTPGAHVSADLAAKATLHLAALLAATRRGQGAIPLLERLVQRPSAHRDEGRLILAQLLLPVDEPRARAVAAEIEDAWIRREAESRLS